MARQVQDQTAYAASYRDPVRAINPFTPTEAIHTGSTTTLPVMGVVIVAGAILLLEHLRRRRGR
jgi:hypothetical protein